MNLNNKKFVTLENKSGLSSGQTVFYYNESNSVITGTYSGGSIIKGNLIGKRTGADTIELLYQCLTDSGELLAGESTGVLRVNSDKLLEIHFEWNWINGPGTGGTSAYIEIASK